MPLWPLSSSRSASSAKRVSLLTAMPAHSPFLLPTSALSACLSAPVPGRAWRTHSACGNYCNNLPAPSRSPSRQSPRPVPSETREPRRYSVIPPRSSPAGRGSFFLFSPALRHSVECPDTPPRPSGRGSRPRIRSPPAKGSPPREYRDTAGALCPDCPDNSPAFRFCSPESPASHRPACRSGRCSRSGAGCALRSGS